MNAFNLFHGDNLDFMRSLRDKTVDLIYIDPPYFSQRNYGDFDDRWKSMQHYLDFMVERLKEMHRLLKPTGSIYVHLDWHAVHYVKVEMDKIFGYKNFRNEIIWHYKGRGMRKDGFQNKHDTILRYSKSNNYLFNGNFVLVDYSTRSKKEFRHTMNGKRYARTWKNGIMTPVFMKNGIIPDDVFDFSMVYSSSKEFLNYKTQKPSKLMERIILASSNEGDLVADFFCGSGSFIKKAVELNRFALGCDLNALAVSEIESYFAKKQMELV